MSRPLEGESHLGTGHDQPPVDLPIEERKFTLAEISGLTGILADVLLTLATEGAPRRTRLSRRQREVFTFVDNEIKKTGNAPSVREIGAALGGISPAAVHEHLTALKKKGYITRSAPRAYDLTILRYPEDKK